MASYAELQADIASWMIGEDITAAIPSFIALAEDRHAWGIVGADGRRNQEQGAIRVREMERRATIPGNDTPYLPLPTDMLEHRQLEYVATTERDRELVFSGSENMAFNANWRPTRYTITRREFRFNGNTPAGSQFQCIYYTRFTRLSATNPTNWLLDNAYGAYLFGALCEADVYAQDDARLALWEGKYAQVVAGLMASEHRTRRSQGQMRVVMGGRSTP